MLSLRRAITSRPRLAAYSRSVGSTVHQSDPNTLAAEKARNLKGEQKSSETHPESAPGWNEKLASESEAQIKADQHGPSGKPSKKLQEQTIEKVHEHHHTDAGKKGAESHHAAKEGARPTGSEDAVKADRGEH